MNALVIGQGGREHALLMKLSQSALIQGLHALPGNDGFSEIARCHDISWKNFNAVLELCQKLEIDFVFIGPEDPLCEGLSDFLREHEVSVIGPSQAAAQLEGSKIFAKEFMARAEIPTSAFEVVHSVEDVQRVSSLFTPPYVLKADGLASGKGVFICQTEAELLKAAIDLFENKLLGAAGERALLEQFMPGWELSFLFLTEGENFVALPIAQDHKRLLDGDQGPNTGGMGTVAPIPVDTKLLAKIEDQVVGPFLSQLKKENLEYKGVVFVGLMITAEGPQVLEFNCRLGDPEAQVILPLINNDFADVCFELSHGRLPELDFIDAKAACVVIAAPGYPDAAKKGVLIEKLPTSTSQSYLLHAGTKCEAGKWYTNGGRVLNSVAIGSQFSEAIQKAYALADQVLSEGKQLRRDIGKQFLN